MTVLHHDFETFSRADLLKVGAAVYARHPSTEPLMCAYAFDDGPVGQWVPAEGEPMPAELAEAIRDPAVIKAAWNKPFEWSIWRWCLGIDTPHRAWVDPMVLALSLSFPAKLEKCGQAMKLDDEHLKNSFGQVLIRFFCKPKKPTKKNPNDRNLPSDDPERWQQFLAYNRQDVVSERGIHKRMVEFDFNRSEREFYVVDQEINEAGIPINTDAAQKAAKLAEHVAKDRLRRMKEVTGLDNPNSQPQLLQWLQDHGYIYEDLRKGHVRAAYDEVPSGPVADVLGWRLESARTSVKKFGALVRATCDDGCLRQSILMHGAGRTGRFAGRIFQPHNLPRPDWRWESGEAQEQIAEDIERLSLEEFVEKYDDAPMDALTTAIRPMVQAGPGKVFVSADLKAIENVVLGVLARDPKILGVFADGRDPYIDFATYLWQRTYEVLWAEYKAGNKSKRTIAKPAVLGCGFMLGPGQFRENYVTKEMEASGLLGYAMSMNISLTQEQAKLSVDTFRRTYHKVVDFWNDIDRAFRTCLTQQRAVECGYLRFEYRPPFVMMRLPSTRPLHYYQPKILDRETPWGEVRPTITYMGLNNQKQWVRLSTHPGKLTENAVQAVARDILVTAIRRARRSRLDVRFHVHDEVVCLAKERQADAVKDRLVAIMRDPPWWLPDAPLGADAHISRAFVKT